MQTQSKWGVAALFAGLVWSVTATAQESVNPAFGPGEQSSYRVRYLGITAGTAQVTVGATMKQWGEEVWPIVAVARSNDMLGVWPIKDKFVSYWQPESQRVVGSDLHADENGSRRRQRIKMLPDGKSAFVVKQKEGEPARESTREVPEGTLDMTGATFALRNQELAVGAEYAYPVFTGSKAFTLRAKVEGREVLGTELGKKEVFKLRVKTEFDGNLASKRDMFVYLTTDPSHVPVRVEADLALGTIVAEITDYKPGRSMAVARAENGG
ncbi:ATP-dependent exoDNAse (exonuclease V) alpha subunit - helicase superfamily I member [Myxococcus hansupus]|uniref:ATP-dependent exoDNAse (Exonuclease V) alpha subunit-helicase superfamily I member n=1 Tax=Pseudomyxococcus hansupus TaxID=1297742 RepID=A0A0H4X0W1_9BACT|nr:DUF3108 domain-containing protein [Myxococcus hansupus]AKQ67483.1 ATP-dependent exoDNAse (exonuclease V) alpha subunit - helicase superfamily I member [Myxococcus hansupus]